jgi:PKD repeat protein
MHTEPSPAAGSAPLTVNFNLCHSSDPDGDALTYVYTFGDGKTRTMSFCRHEHTYESRGTYTASLCVTDGRSSACNVVTVTVS